MSQTTQSEQPVVGFITVVKNREIGYLGGYLILNRNGRPVEFHCTAPIKATKSQHILFGPTLDPYLCGEQIARALVIRSAIMPKIILTDNRHVLALRPMVQNPVMLVEVPPQTEEKKNAKNDWTEQKNLEQEHINQLKGEQIEEDDQSIIVPSGSLLWRGVLLHPTKKQVEDSDNVKQFLVDMDIEFDLAEPFERIREAIIEAQKSAA